MLSTVPVSLPQYAPSSIHQDIRSQSLAVNITPLPVTIPEVPFFSQFKDITSAKWKKVGCGVASLAMIIEYYKPDTVSVDKLLGQAIASGAYQHSAGWTHQGLVTLSKKYGLNGAAYDLAALSSGDAFNKFKDFLSAGPAIVSVHYKFDPRNPIPHLVVIDGVKDGVVYYNDPAGSGSEKQISSAQFLKAWKKRFIILRPAGEKVLAVT